MISSMTDGQLPLLLSAPIVLFGLGLQSHKGSQIVQHQSADRLEVMPVIHRSYHGPWLHGIGSGVGMPS